MYCTSCCTDCRLWILPLHSKITTLGQGDVFKKPEEGFRKVEFNSLIAMSSACTIEGHGT